jgi:hypothetical protein
MRTEVKIITFGTLSISSINPAVILQGLNLGVPTCVFHVYLWSPLLKYVKEATDVI